MRRRWSRRNAPTCCWPPSRRASNIPAGPTTVREWSESIVVERDVGGAERATFAGAGAASSTADRGVMVARHIDGLRAAAVAMLWGRESAQGPDGLPRYPRLRRLLVDQWEETRRTCEGPDKLLMFFDATLALDRAAEPKVGREAFKTLSLPSTEAAKKEVRVGTIGVPFEAIIDTGKFKKGVRPAAAREAAVAKPAQGPWPTPQVSSMAQPSRALPAEDQPEPVQSAMTRTVTVVIALVVLGVLAYAFLPR